MSRIIEHTKDDFAETTFFDAPNFLILFAAIAFLNGVLPPSKISEGVDQYAARGVDWDRAAVNLAALAQALDDDSEEQGPHFQFVAATKSTTHRISSRKVRFEAVVKAIANDVAGA